MILGTGIDLLKVSRVKKILDKYGDLFIKKIFSDEEIKNNKEIIFKVNRLAKSFAPVSTLIPGTAPVSEIVEGIVLPSFDCWLIVSSYKITPPTQVFIVSDEKSMFLNFNLFSAVETTFTLSSLLVIVPVLSSVAKIPLPEETIFSAMEFNSDI